MDKYDGGVIVIPDTATDVAAYNGLYGCACGCGGDYAYLHLNGVEGWADEDDLSPTRFRRRLNRLNRAITDGDPVFEQVTISADGQTTFIYETRTSETGGGVWNGQQGRCVRIYFTVRED